MKAVFADTGYWVALIDPDDSLHQKVLLVSGALRGTFVVTTELLLIEALNHFSNYGHNSRRTAVAAIKQARLAASVVSPILAARRPLSSDMGRKRRLAFPKARYPLH